MIPDWGRTAGNAVLKAVGRTVGQAQEQRPLPVDLLESHDAFLAVFDAPGISTSDVAVRIEDGRIEVRVDRFRPAHEEFDMTVPGRGMSLDGHVELPEDATVDPDAAEATLKDVGELHVRVPKVDEGTDTEEAEGGAGDEGDT
ncbi:MAG: Hsp20 family protein [Haloarculaceae archaeon]